MRFIRLTRSRITQQGGPKPLSFEWDLLANNNIDLSFDSKEFLLDRLQAYQFLALSLIFKELTNLSWLSMSPMLHSPRLRFVFATPNLPQLRFFSNPAGPRYLL